MIDRFSSANEWTPYLTGTFFSPSTISEGWFSSCKNCFWREHSIARRKRDRTLGLHKLTQGSCFPSVCGPEGWSRWLFLQFLGSNLNLQSAGLDASSAGLGTKDPRGEVPCLSSQWRLALTLEHFSASFLYLGSFGWSLRSVLSFTSALTAGLSCLAASPRGPWCSMGPAYGKDERQQPVVSSQWNGDKLAAGSRVYLFWSLGRGFF